MVSCCVCGSTARKGSPLSFHVFPRNPARRSKWITFANKGNWMPNNRSVVCSKHFSEDDFDWTSSSVVRLKAGAIPSLIVNRVKYLKYHCPEEVVPVSETSNGSELAILEEGSSLLSESSSGDMGTIASPSKNGTKKRRKVHKVIGLEALKTENLGAKLKLKKMGQGKRPILPKGTIKVTPTIPQNLTGITALQNDQASKQEPTKTKATESTQSNPALQREILYDIPGLKLKCEDLEIEIKCLKEKIDSLGTIIRSKDAALQYTRELNATLRKKNAQKEETLMKLTEMLKSVFSGDELHILTSNNMDLKTKLQLIRSVS